MVRSRSQSKQTAANKPPEMDEESLKKYYSILEDFDKQMETRLEENASRFEGLARQIRNLYRVKLLSLPKHVRKMNAITFFDTVKANQNGTSDSQEDEDAENDPKSINLLPPPPVTSTAVKATAKKRGRVKSEAVAMTDAGVRRSTRKTANSAFKTPSVSNSRQNVLATPLTITAKFDINTPLHKTAVRLARPNETLVSLTGSPVIVPTTAAGPTGGKSKSRTGNAAAAAAKKKAVEEEIDAVDDKLVHIFSNNEIDLDDSAKKKLLALKTQIETALNDQ